MENEKKYLEAVEKILKSGLPPHSVAKRIVSLRLWERPATMSYKEFGFASGISYRSVLRWAKVGKIKTISTPGGTKVLCASRIA